MAEITLNGRSVPIQGGPDVPAKMWAREGCYRLRMDRHAYCQWCAENVPDEDDG